MLFGKTVRALLTGRTLIILLAVASATASTSVLAVKTDIVKLKNGDLITGEIKSLDFGALSFSTDSMGTVTIDWEDVLGARSDQSLQVELVDGTRYYGSLEKGDGHRDIHITTSSGEVSFATADIVRMTPIDSESSFLSQLDGSISLGFQAQKSSNVYTSNLAADASYRTRKFLWGARLNSTMTDSANEEGSMKQSLSLNYQRFRPDRWFAEWFTGWERNDELGIQSRTSAGAAWGKYLIQTNSNMLSVTGGVQAARQTFTGEDPSDTDYEGRLELRYLHRKLVPKTSINLTSQFYPLLRDFSQYRSQTDLNLNWEFIADMFLGVGFSYSYTSNPPTDASNSDYSVTTSLGYSF